MLRIIWGLFFIGSSIFNLTYTMNHPEFYDQYVDVALFQFLSEFIEKSVVPNATAFTILLIIFEFIVGIFILSKRVFVKVGLICSIVFCIALVPVIPPYTYVNLLVVILPVFLLRKQYSTALKKDAPTIR